MTKQKIFDLIVTCFTIYFKMMPSTVSRYNYCQENSKLI